MKIFLPFVKVSFLFILLFFIFINISCDSPSTSTTLTRKNSGIKFLHQDEYSFTLWVETNLPPDDSYYDQIAVTLTSTPHLSFNKVIVRVNGDGAASGLPWFDSMNPAGNNNNPIILEILRKLQGTDVTVYALPYLSTTPDEFWDIYAGTVDDAPSLSTWMAAHGGVGAFDGTLKQSVHWIKDMNNIAQTMGITKTFSGIVYETQGSPYPSVTYSDATLQAIKTYFQDYGLTNIKIAATAEGPGNGSIFVQYAQEGVLDEGYIEMYNLTDNPTIDPTNTYIDAMGQGAISTPTVPVYPNSIYTDAWLSDPSTAAQKIWETNPATFKPGQDMGFQHSHDPSVNIGLLTYGFYNGGNGYYYGLGCTPGQVGCPKIYFMFSTECGPNQPPGITCDCVVSGCPQSVINAFGTWSPPEGLDQFLQFIDLANDDWQLPTDQFAIFQYQLLPNNWLK